jgi:2-oxoglutarate dehydrogenase E2 component (dihydrolipoamide succinyltransferase)
MASDVIVPRMGESISSGILAKWLVADGAPVRRDQPLFSLETDKITMEVTAAEDGVLSILAPEGSEVAVDQKVATIASSATPAKPDTPAVPAQAAKIGPAARRLAAELGVDAAAVPGTGHSGVTTREDVEKAAKPAAQAVPATPQPPPPAPLPPPPVPAPSSGALRQTREKMSPLRRRLSERLVRAKNETAMLTTFNECDMSAVMNLRKVHQDAFQKKHGVKLGFMSFFVKAVTAALRDVPQLNVQVEGDEIVHNHFFDIGIAVGAPRGLVVPVVRDADRKSFAQIERDILDYGTKAREGRLTIDELQGGVFTITNGGIYGSLMSTPILNPPQSGILGMHAIKERAVVVDGAVVARQMMYLALSYDHRVVDGREAVTFLVKVKEAIEDPVRLLFEV